MGNLRPYRDRDNYLSKNAALLSAAKVLQRRLLGKLDGIIPPRLGWGLLGSARPAFALTEKICE